MAVVITALTGKFVELPGDVVDPKNPPDMVLNCVADSLE
jgi:hypothetical protein